MELNSDSKLPGGASDAKASISHGGSGILARLKSGQSKLVGIGFAGAVVLISLAGAYALYGNASDRQLETGNSNVRQGNQQDSGQVGPKEEEDNDMQDNAAGQSAGETSGAASNDSQSTTNVTVNGQRVDVPANGSYSQTIEDGNSRTEIRTESNHSNTTTGNGSSSSNNSSVNINISSGSSSTSQ